MTIENNKKKETVKNLVEEAIKTARIEDPRQQIIIDLLNLTLSQLSQYEPGAVQQTKLIVEKVLKLDLGNKSTG